MSIVIDSSAIVPLALTDEDSEYANTVLEKMVEHIAFVPSLFWYEIGNILITNEKRKRINKKNAETFISRLRMLPITTDYSFKLDKTMYLARKHNLSAYDASYLDLALCSNGVFATLDKKLRQAAKAENIKILK
jgi:predicted nucleic acid-binding protein